MFYGSCEDVFCGLQSALVWFHGGHFESFLLVIFILALSFMMVEF